MKIFVSVPHQPIADLPHGDYRGHNWRIQPRDFHWELRSARKYLHHWQQAIKVLRAAREYDALLLCHVGLEAFFAGRLRRRFYPRKPLIVVDLLMPQPRRFTALAAPWLRRIDAFGCVRSGDIGELQRRFNIAAHDCFFAPFPANPVLQNLETQPGDCLYSAGQAHRDWETLIAAVNLLPYPLRIATPHDLSALNPQAHIALLEPQQPAAGRALAAQSALIVLSFKDTLLPSGPLVLLDALAMGKAVVASEVNGTRDYVRNGETGILVPPHDVEALRAAIDKLMSDGPRRQKMGAAARADVKERFTVDNFLAPILQRLEQRLEP